jgi:hypothetical protein
MFQYEFYFDSILEKLSRAATWRRSIAARHPADARNLKAVAELTRLAKSRFADVSPQAWADVRPALESPNFNEALNQATRDVAFRSNPADMDAFLRLIAKAADALALPLAAGAR